MPIMQLAAGRLPRDTTPGIKGFPRGFMVPGQVVN